MRGNRVLLLALAGLLIATLIACSAPAPSATPAPAQAASGEVALRVSGMVAQEMGWTEDQVRAMETTEAQSTNNAGETKAYTGVQIAQLLDQAGVQGGATKLVCVADDGQTAEVALAEVRDCADCIVSFRNQGGFSIVMPGFPGNVQVKGVVEIRVK